MALAESVITKVCGERQGGQGRTTKNHPQKKKAVWRTPAGSQAGQREGQKKKRPGRPTQARGTPGTTLSEKNVVPENSYRGKRNVRRISRPPRAKKSKRKPRTGKGGDAANVEKRGKEKKRQGQAVPQPDLKREEERKRGTTGQLGAWR